MAVTLFDAETRLSEVIQVLHTRGEDAVITVDGEPVARLVSLKPSLRPLSTAEVLHARLQMDRIMQSDRPSDAFDAVLLVAEGRR
jgi:antitoxin (DNA-binding transcriptional repressor) of toxin-antitoxin stability system